MKKFLTQGKYKDDQPRQRQRIEEERKFSKHDSSGQRENYFAGENMSMGYGKHSYQMERKSRATQSIQNCDYKKNRYNANPSSESLHLNEANKGAKYSGATENYNKFHNASPLYPNKGYTYPHSKNPTLKDDFPKTTDTRIKSKKFTSMNDAKDIQRNSNKTSINEENPSINSNTHFKQSSLSLLQKYSTPPYESNQLLQYYNKQNNDQSNKYVQDLSKNNVYTHEERANCQSYNNITFNSPQNTAFLNGSSSSEGMGFSTFKLKDLLYYNVNLMQEQQLFEYAAAVRCKILEKIDKFQHPAKDELEILCEITDGDQSEKNQRLITTRTCQIVKNIIEEFPQLLNAQEIPCSSQIVYKIAPNLHDTANSYCNNYGSPVLEVVQNSVMLCPSVKDYNLMSEYNIAQNGMCVHPKSNPNSFDIEGTNDYRENCEVQDFSTNNAKNSNPINLFITEENKDMTSSEHYCPPAVNSECTPADKFSFNEDTSIFIEFGLDNLLNYNVNAMHGDKVFDYAFSMKQRILENIHHFRDPFKEKLEFLCELTDGTQREINQKLINEQMCYLINLAYGNEYVPDDNSF